MLKRIFFVNRRHHFRKVFYKSKIVNLDDYRQKNKPQSNMSFVKFILIVLSIMFLGPGIVIK